MVTEAKSTSSAGRLEARLVDSDGYLTRSLNLEEQSRRRTRLWLVAISCLLGSAACIFAFVLFANSNLMASDKSSQGWTLWKQRRLPEAEAKFREALMEDAKDGDAWTGLGWCLTNMGRMQDAIDAFKKAVEIQPDNISAQNGIGQCALGIGNFELAEEYLKKSSDGLIKLAGGEGKLTENNVPAAWYGLVNLYLLKDDFVQAKQWTDRIAKVSPGTDTLKVMLEQIEKKDSTQTKKLFGNASATQVDASSKAKAWQLWQSGKPQEAIPLFRELVKADPKDTNSFNGLGWALLNTGKAKEAREFFLQCLKLEEEHGAALNGVGQASLSLHDWSQAEEYLQKASDVFLKEVPESQLSAQNLPAAWYGLARVHLLQGNYDKATTWCERILKYDAGSTDVAKMLESARKKDNSEIKKLFGVN